MSELNMPCPEGEIDLAQTENERCKEECLQSHAAEEQGLQNEQDDTQSTDEIPENSEILETEQTPPPTKKGLAWWNILLLVLSALIILFVGAQLCLNAMCFVVYVDGTSMQNTLHDGEYVYAHRKFEAKRGDIVVIDVSPYEGVEKAYIKRLVGLEGDTFYCEDGVVYRRLAGQTEFVPLEYDQPTRENYRQITVGEGEIFFLGDNRAVSQDSFPIGKCYKVEDIIGVVPQWAVDIKGFSTGYERFRSSLVSGIKNLFNIEED